ncbi:MAG: protein TolR [Desulfobacterales bacterium]|nr:protein TolR [Desulfobacterales bacterium]
MVGGDSDRLMSDINVTPFVDVMLVLLIIFMVTAPMMTQGVDVALPQATTKPLPADVEQLTITVNKDHKIYINDFPVPLELLKEKLGKIVEGQPDRNIYLRADKDIAYGTVVRVMVEIKAAGVNNLGMITVPIEEQRKGTR